MASSSSISNSRSWSNASKFFTRDKVHMCKAWDEGKVADEDQTPMVRKGVGMRRRMGTASLRRRSVCRGWS